MIIVALVAGGVPLLWMYRDIMPLPKAWQWRPQAPAVQTPPAEPAAGSDQAKPVTPPKPNAPTATVPKHDTPKSEPARIEGQEHGRKVEAHEPTQTQAGPAKPEPSAHPEPSESAVADKDTPSPADAKPKPLATPQRQSASSQRPPAKSAGECTEALAAVGLCTQKATRK